jgi:hypothetical protein
MMKMEVHHYFHGDHSDVNEKLNAILNLLRESKTREVHMSAEMDALAAAVTENTTLDDSIINLLNGIAAQLTATAGDKAQALALAAELNAKSAALSAAITANTPAAPPA